MSAVRVGGVAGAGGVARVDGVARSGGAARPQVARPRAGAALAGTALDAMRAFLLNLGYLLAVALVVTAPAATTALVSATRRWRQDGEVPTVRTFVGDVRDRFRTDLPLGLALLGLGAVLALDLLLIGTMGDQRRVLLVLWLGCVLALALLAVALPVVAAEAAAAGRADGVVTTARRALARTAHRPFAAFAAVAVLAGAVGLATVSPLSLLLTPVVVAALGERLLGVR